MLKSKINLLLKVSSLASCFFMAGCLSLSGCSGKGMKLVHTTSMTDQNAYVGVMVSEERGIVAGEKGLVLNTSDGGKTWQADKIIAPFIAGLSAVNENVCYMNGDTRVFMKTTDGGKTKEILPRTNFAIGKGVNMLDENVGWVWGKETVLGGLYEYDDSSKDFIKLPLPEGSSYVESALITERGKGFMLDTKGFFFETSDYGKNWKKSSEIFTDEGIKPVVKNLLPTNSVWKDAEGIRVAYIGKKDGTEYHFVMKTSRDGGNSFTKDFDKALKKDPKSFTVNYRNEICILNQDTTMDVYIY